MTDQTYDELLDDLSTYNERIKVATEEYESSLGTIGSAVVTTTENAESAEEARDEAVAAKDAAVESEALNKLNSVATSFGVTSAEVVSSNDTETTLDGVLYIYDEDTGVTYAKPQGISSSDVISSLVYPTLTTSSGEYTLIRNKKFIKSIAFNPLIDFKPLNMSFKPAFGGVSDEDFIFNRNNLDITDPTGLVSRDSQGYYVSLDQAENEYLISYPNLPANSSFTISTKMSHSDDYANDFEPFIFSFYKSSESLEDAQQKFGLVMGSTLTVWNGTDFYTVSDRDYRDGVVRLYEMSFNAVNGLMIIKVDDEVVFYEQMNSSTSDRKFKPTVNLLIFGGYSVSTTRGLNGKIYSASLIPEFTDNISGVGAQSCTMKNVMSDMAIELPTGQGLSPLSNEPHKSMEFIPTYIIIGQSNASGRADVSDLLDPAFGDNVNVNGLVDFNKSILDVFVSRYNVNAISRLDVGVNQHFGADNTSSTFGPEVGIGINENLNGNKCFMVRHSKGSTSLYSDWNPYSGTEGTEYLEAVTAITESFNLAISKGYIPILKGIIWMQGERDATGADGGDPSAYYETYLTELLTNIKLLAGTLVSSYSLYAKGVNNNARVVIPNIKIGTTKVSSYPYEAEVTAAQLSFANATTNVVTVDTSNFPQDDDDLHFNAEGQIKLGMSIYSAVGKLRVAD